MAQAFDESYYNSLNEDQKIRLLTCCLSGVANADSCMGCYAMNPNDYDEFSTFFRKALEQYHCVDLSKTKHVNNWSFKGVEGLPADGKLDLSKLGLPALSMRVRTGRNLKKYPLPGAMTKEDRINMEKDMKKVYDTLIADPKFGGQYISITPGHENFIDDAEYNKWVKAHIMFKDMSEDSYLLSAGIAGDWPHGRGCYVSADKGFIIWNGEEDHLRIMCMAKGTILNDVFDRLENAVKVVQEKIEGGCAMSADYGVVTSCPTNIGTGMRASVHIQLPNLCWDGTDDEAKRICKPLGLSVRGTGGEHTPIGADGTVDISPSKRFCISEAEIVVALYKGIKLLKEKEEAAKFDIKTVNGKYIVDAESAPAIVARIMKIKKAAKFADNCMAQAFDESYYNSLNQDQKIRLLTCCLSGVANPDSCMGCYAMNPNDYDEFSTFFRRALELYHKVDLNKTKHVNNWSFKGVEGLPEDGKLDLSKLGLPALSMRVRTGRNLKKYPLPGAMTKEDRINMEKDMKKVYDILIADPTYGGQYISITPGHECFINDEEYNKWVKAHIMFKDMSEDSYLVSAGIAGDWPHGRGCYVSADKGFIIWNGEEDHLRIMCMAKGTILNTVFDRLETAIKVVQDNIDGGCAISADYGVVTSCPTNIGTGMRASVHIQLPNLTADGTDAQAKAVCRPLGLSVRGTGGEHTPIGADGTVDISPSKRFCISEAEIVVALYKGIRLLKEKEDAAPKRK